MCWCCCLLLPPLTTNGGARQYISRSWLSGRLLATGTTETGRDGFSPYHIVFGKAPHLSGISDGNLITDDELTKNDLVRRHFHLQEKARTELKQVTR